MRDIALVFGLACAVSLVIWFVMMYRQVCREPSYYETLPGRLDIIRRDTISKMEMRAKYGDVFRGIPGSEWPQGLAERFRRGSRS